MGLDIYAYKNLKKAPDAPLDEYGVVMDYRTHWKAGGVIAYTETHFPGRSKGIEADAVYTYEDAFGFRAGSYSGYNWWRRQLEDFAEGNDFYELIEFSDCEGVIGPYVSKKLAEDFQKNEEKAVAFSKSIETGDYWLEAYLKWKKAFEMASENGAVEFR